ncbi:PREDICTED: exonuclease 1 [Wasmannia auropunctata]|uniref:exonuclease 1 n=1 Tax=Wasmannia auropunctata TaxID=64793 RepID=UPI0005F0421B|nr:PREDICTED: exonuclease 1 [Wasmannia auropunctata]
MGITGLLPFLEKSSRRTNIKEFSGGTVAIDSYCWLHKGAFSCAEKLMMGEATDAYVVYCMKYINMLLKHKIKPILVFDGQRLPAKEQTEIKRRKAREMNRRKAVELIQMGQVAEGTNLLRRAVDITHQIALELIKHCQNENIDCIIAPYEADAQLAYLNISGIADVVITEDSDLTLFGCKKIFFKMDLTGNGVLIEQDRLYLAMGVRPEEFDMDKFRHICILSGCDYLPSLPGIGLGKARKFITRNTDHNIHRALTRIGSVLNMKSLSAVTQEYRDAFILADITFKHQLVFCPLQRRQVRLNPPPADITEDQLRYAGKELDEDLALQLALGNCDPATLKAVHDFNPDKIDRKRKRDAKTGQMMIETSIWSSKYKSKYQNSSPKNKLNSSIVIEKQLAREKKSLKEVSLNSHNGSIMQNDRPPEYQDLNDTAILDMYNSSRDAKPIANAADEESEDYLSLSRINVSPELVRQRNPFIKRVSDLTTSPSVLANGNCRKRGKNLMRIRRTIIDENTDVVESKYFSKQDTEERNVLEPENKEIEVNLKSTKCNTSPDMNTNIHDIGRKQLKRKLQTFCTKSVTDVIQNANSVENDDAFLSNENDCLTDRDIPEKSSPNDRIDDVLSMAHTKTDKNYRTDIYRNAPEGSNPNDTIDDVLSMAHTTTDKNCITDTRRNAPERSNLNDRIDDVSSMAQITTDESCIIDHFLVSKFNVATNDITNYENANLQNNLFKWSNTENDRTFSYNIDMFKKQNSANLVSPKSRVNSVTKRKQLRQSKSPSVPRQQSLLSMYGFQKRSSLKH